MLATSKLCFAFLLQLCVPTVTVNLWKERSCLSKALLCHEARKLRNLAAVRGRLNQSWNDLVWAINYFYVTFPYDLWFQFSRTHAHILRRTVFSVSLITAQVPRLKSTPALSRYARYCITIISNSSSSLLMSNLPSENVKVLVCLLSIELIWHMQQMLLYKNVCNAKLNVAGCVALCEVFLQMNLWDQVVRNPSQDIMSHHWISTISFLAFFPHFLFRPLSDVVLTCCCSLLALEFSF